MGLLYRGQWVDRWYDTDQNDGAFVRETAQLRHWITPDGEHGPSGEGGFPAQSGRYHLYVALACPWAHRTLIFRQLKGLSEHIGVSVVSPDMLEQGWSFDRQQGSSGDALYGLAYLHQLYTRHQRDYSGRVTVPVLWDKQRQCIVSNESAEILRMFNSAFNGLTGNTDDYYPQPLQPAIDALNEQVYAQVNNGVYRAGFATRQAAYEQAYDTLFEALDGLEQRLESQRYLLGPQITEADWRLFTTLVRFDAVYYSHFKCNRQRLADYPQLSAYVRELYQWPGIAATIDMAAIKRHYYYSHATINPTRVVPLGPQLDFQQPHGRDRLPAAPPAQAANPPRSA